MKPKYVVASVVVLAVAVLLLYLSITRDGGAEVARQQGPAGVLGQAGSKATSGGGADSAVAELQQRVQSQIAASAVAAAIIFDQPGGLGDMVETIQPAGCSVITVCESQDQQYTAFLSRDPSNRIVVMERKTGKESVVPAPEENLPELRTIWALQWGSDGTLYVVEEAVDRKLSMDDYSKLDRDRRAEQRRPVLYSWRPGDAKTSSIDQVKGPFGGLTAGSDGSVRLVTRSEEKGWGFIDIRTYRNGKREQSRTFSASLAGEPIDVWSAQALSRRNELWFITAEFVPRKVSRRWLAVLDLDKPDAGARLVLADVKSILLSPDEERLTILKMPRTASSVTYSFYTLPIAPKTEPVALFAKQFITGEHVLEPEFVGQSTDGKKLYFRCLAKEHVSQSALFQPGNTKILEASTTGN